MHAAREGRLLLLPESRPAAYRTARRPTTEAARGTGQGTRSRVGSVPREDDSTRVRVMGGPSHCFAHLQNNSGGYVNGRSLVGAFSRGAWELGRFRRRPKADS